MHQNFIDSIAMTNELGKPDLFITMTCNPNWTEIKSNLLPGQSVEDRPDLVARVFNLKKKELMKLVVDDKIFGMKIVLN